MPRKPNFYFDNKKVEELILKYKKEKNENLIKEIMKELDKIVYAIINKYHFYNFEDYDELVQQARLVCLECIPKYDTKKVLQKNKSIFSYFSCAVKKNLRFQTYKKSNLKVLEINQTNLNNYDEYKNNNSQKSDFSDDSVFKNIYQQSSLYKYENDNSEFQKIENQVLFDILKSIFVQKSKRKSSIRKNTRMYNLCVILQKYIELFNDFKLSEFIKFSQSYGYTPEYVRNFFKILKKNKNYIKQNFFV